MAMCIRFSLEVESKSVSLSKIDSRVKAGSKEGAYVGQSRLGLSCSLFLSLGLSTKNKKQQLFIFFVGKVGKE